MKKKRRFFRYSTQDKLLLLVGYVLLGLFVVAIIVPMIYIVVASFMDPVTLQNKGITFDFEKWTTTAYERVMSNAQIWIGIFITRVMRGVAVQSAIETDGEEDGESEKKESYRCNYDDENSDRRRRRR